MNFTEKEYEYILGLLETQKYKAQTTINKVMSNPGWYIDDVEELRMQIRFVEGLIGKVKTETETETSRYCSISSAHLSKETDTLLREIEDEKNNLPIYFPKRINGILYGYIFVVAGWNDSDERHSVCPDDLRACLEYAQSLGCAMLVIDGDCEIVEGLQVYDW